MIEEQMIIALRMPSLVTGLNVMFDCHPIPAVTPLHAFLFKNHWNMVHIYQIQYPTL